MLVDPQQDTSIIAELVGSEGIAAGGAQGQHVPPRTCV